MRYGSAFAKIALAVVSLALVACGGMPPLAIPKGAPVILSIDVQRVSFNATDRRGRVFNYSDIGSFVLTEAVEAQASTQGLTAEARVQQQALSSLFEQEVRIRFERQGGKTASSAGPAVVVVRIDNLVVGYHNVGFFGVDPVAAVRVHSTSDPSNVKPNPSSRTIETRVRDAAFSIPSLNSFVGDREKGYAGLRKAVVDLAERVSTSISKAQNGDSER